MEREPLYHDRLRDIGTAPADADPRIAAVERVREQGCTCLTYPQVMGLGTRAVVHINLVHEDHCPLLAERRRAAR